MHISLKIFEKHKTISKNLAGVFFKVEWYHRFIFHRSLWYSYRLNLIKILISPNSVRF